MNKKAMGVGTIAVILGVIAVIGILGYMATNNVNLNTNNNVNDTTPPEKCADSTATLTVNAISALNKGATVTPTIKYGVDGSSVTNTLVSGTTTFPVGAEVTILANATDYIDKSATVTIKCGGSILELPMYYSTSDNPEIKIENDDGQQTADDGAGTNQSNIEPGEDLTVKVQFKGSSQESSGKGIYIVETPANTGTSITNIELDGKPCEPLPMGISAQNAASKVCAFTIDPIEGSTVVEKSLTFITTGTGDWDGLVLTDWYAMQEFVDDDGTISEGITDSDGDAKYENHFDRSFVVEAA